MVKYTIGLFYNYFHLVVHNMIEANLDALAVVIIIIIITTTYFFCKEPSSKRHTTTIIERGEDEIPTGSNCSLDDAERMAFTKKRSMVFAKGKLYWGNRSTHAELIYLDESKDETGPVGTIFMKYAPCSNCARKLNEDYKNSRKPIIYSGKIRPGYDNFIQINCQGLRDLLNAGFDLQVWKTPMNKEQEDIEAFLAQL